jgi:hypothetical protein
VTSVDDRGYVRTAWFGDAEKEHGYFHLDALISGPAEPQCVGRHDRGDGILFEASASLNGQLVPFSREAPGRDAQEVDRLGDVLDFLLGHGPTPTKRALTLGTYFGAT